MTEVDLENIKNYWLETAQHDFDTMVSLFRTKRYSDTLFYGHIVLEKMLKAAIVVETKKHAPRIHDLVRLYEISGLKMSQKDVKLLDEVNDFNIRSRYPDYKLKFYKLCTRKFTQDYFNYIKNVYKKLCQKLKPKE